MIRYYVANATTAPPVDNHSDRPQIGSTNSLKLTEFLKNYPQPVDSNENLLHCSQYVPLNRRPDVDHKCETVDVGPSRAAGGRPVPSLVTGLKLREAIEKQSFIERGDLRGVDGVKYDFRMGSKILKASLTQTVDMKNLQEIERSQVCVEPGEVVFVMTEERLKLPANMIATLSPKRTLAHSGIIVLGGFAIDPNYQGVLWMGLYNFSSTKFPLSPGRKLIAAMFYELNDDEVGEFSVPTQIADDNEFPSDLVNLIKNYKPIELKGILDEIRDTKKDVELLRADFLTDKSWKDDFKKGLESHNTQIDKLLEGLREEKAARERDDDRIRSKLESMSGFFTLAQAAWVLVALIIGGFLEWGIPKAIDAVRPQPVVTNPQAAPLPAPTPPPQPEKK